MLKKSEAVKMFGQGQLLAEALGVTPGAVGHWDETLTERRVNEIVGAAYRRRMTIPDKVFLEGGLSTVQDDSPKVDD